MVLEAELKRSQAGITAERAGDVRAAIRSLIVLVKRSPEISRQARDGVLLATHDSHMSARIDACKALALFDMDTVSEARLRLLMASDHKRDVRRAAMRTLLFQWSRYSVGNDSTPRSDIRGYLEGNGITKLYHITSERNLTSIKQSGAILSASRLRESGIKRVICVSTAKSRADDHISGTDHWVHLHFHYNQPMFFRALTTNACPDLLILDINMDVLNSRPVVFSNENASASSAVLGPDLGHLQSFNLEPFIRGNWHPTEKAVWQAEILVHDQIDWSYVMRVRRFADAVKQHRDSVSPQQRDQYHYHQHHI